MHLHTPTHTDPCSSFLSRSGWKVVSRHWTAPRGPVDTRRIEQRTKVDFDEPNMDFLHPEGFPDWIWGVGTGCGYMGWPSWVSFGHHMACYIYIYFKITTLLRIKIGIVIYFQVKLYIIWSKPFFNYLPTRWRFFFTAKTGSEPGESGNERSKVGLDGWGNPGRSFWEALMH